MIKLRNWKISTAFFTLEWMSMESFPFYNLSMREKGPLEGRNSITENCQAEKNIRVCFVRFFVLDVVVAAKKLIINYLTLCIFPQFLIESEKFFVCLCERTMEGTKR
jgi:hypothetical protein